jgi:TET-associated glycosyltransferase-like protein
VKLLIAIPSKGRAALFQNTAFRWLPALGYDYKIFVEPQDYVAYQDVTPELVQLEANDRGLAYAKQTITSYAAQQGYDLIFKMDDDIHWWSTGYGKMDYESTLAALGMAIPQCMDYFARQPQIQAVGFNYAVFMHAKGSPVWSLNQRLQTAYIVRTQSVYPHPAISTFEDYFTTLMIWLNGGCTLRCNLAGMNMGGGGLIAQNSGGLQSFDRSALAIREIERMRAIYPGLKVKRVKDKPWIHEPDFAAIKRDLFPVVK